MRQVFAEEKSLLALKHVKAINVPRWPEVCVKVLFEHYKNDPEVMLYLPDKFSKGRTIDRNYFFAVLNTVRPEHVAMIIQNARNKRFEAHGEEEEKQTITISPHWH